MAIFFSEVLCPELHVLAFAWEVLYGWSHVHHLVTLSFLVSAL